MFKCNKGEKSFITNHGRLVHTSKIHKEEFQNKRKGKRDQNQKCYICGFTFLTDETFKAHMEAIHKQEYIIQRSDSITKSPPVKKIKEQFSKIIEDQPSNIEVQKVVNQDIDNVVKHKYDQIKE